MSEELEIGETAKSSSSISRRNALKTGAALGVGAAAFAGPQIGILGAAPAYAAHCSPGKFDTIDGDDRNVDCGGGCQPHFRTHGEKLTQNGITATIPDKVCTNIVTPLISGIPGGTTCEVQLGIYENNPADAEFFTLPAPTLERDLTGGGTPVPGTSYYSCNSRVFLRLVCGPDDCFHS